MPHAGANRYQSIVTDCHSRSECSLLPFAFTKCRLQFGF